MYDTRQARIDSGEDIYCAFMSINNAKISYVEDINFVLSRALLVISNLLTEVK
jgi:hypothetical protein